MKDSDFELLYEALRELPASGEAGLEGLICRLMKRWTGQRFYLCKSGSQRGRDFGTGGEGANSIAVESKRFRKKTALKTRELLGEIVEISGEIPQLDLWILVVSRDVSEQIATKLHAEAKKQGFSALIIDTCGRLSRLAVLCAEFPGEVTDHVATNAKGIDSNMLSMCLKEIRDDDDYHVEKGALKSTLFTTFLGYDDFRSQSHRWLTEQVSDVDKAHKSFGQPLGIRVDPKKLPVPRRGIKKALDDWWKGGPPDVPCIALVGEEGTGKSWACMDWVLDKVRNEAFPATLIFTHNRLNTLSDPEDVLASAIYGIDSRVGADKARKRIQNWFSGPNSGGKCLCVFDGLNESSQLAWKRFLRTIASDEWRRALAVIVTTRPRFFKSDLVPLDAFRKGCISVGDYTDEETGIGLARLDLTLDDIPTSIRPLVRKPRYLDLVAQHRDKMVSSNDFTEHRLIYEDWKDRCGRKDSLRISDEQFKGILVQAVGRIDEGERFFTERSIHDLMPSPNLSEADFNELRSGGIFVPTGESSRPYKVEPRKLVHGLGLLLAEELRRVKNAGPHEMDSALDAWLEPGADSDLKVQICGAAVFYCLRQKDYPPEGRLALLRWWLGARNMSRADEEMALQ